MRRPYPYSVPRRTLRAKLSKHAPLLRGDLMHVKEFPILILPVTDR